MKIPQDHIRFISKPSKEKWVRRAARADRMDRICWATTDSTSTLMRLNSSKQPQAPVCGVGGRVAGNKRRTPDWEKLNHVTNISFLEHSERRGSLQTMCALGTGGRGGGGRAAEHSW